MAHEITINMLRKPQAPLQAVLGLASERPGSIGAWGTVNARHSEDHTVDVTLASGFDITRIPVASREWATVDDKEKPLLGGRDLPPVGAIVFILMPTGEPETGFVIASLMPPLSPKLKTDFLVKDKEAEALSVIEGGWKKTYDKEKGDLQIEDDDTFVLIVKKSEKKIDLTDWNGNNLVIDENGAKITDANSNEITMDASGIVVLDKNGNKVELASGGATITTAQGKITGGTFQMNGAAAPSGSGPFCGLPACLFTGAPHVGNLVSGT